MFVLQNSVPRRIFGLRGGKTQQPWNRYFHFSHSHKRSELLASPLLRTRGKVKLECIFADLFSLGFSCMCLTLSVYIFVHVCITEGPQISPERVHESLNLCPFLLLSSFSSWHITPSLCECMSLSPHFSSSLTSLARETTCCQESSLLSVRPCWEGIFEKHISSGVILRSSREERETGFGDRSGGSRTVHPTLI